MKKRNFFFGAAVAAALLGAMATDAHARRLTGWAIVSGLCTQVSTIPNDCTQTAGQPCTNAFFNKSATNPAQCVDPRYKPL